MLTQEYGIASNIKSRVNSLSVLAAITSTQQRLKLYNRDPPNGLVLFIGTILTGEGKEKNVSFDFGYHKPVNTILITRPLSRSFYFCNNKFHTEALLELLESNSRVGFIDMDGNGTLFETLARNTRKVIHKFTSALRFSRLRGEKKHNYHFITNDKVNVMGPGLAGSTDFQTELNQSDMFDLKLAAKIIKVVDVSYGEENGSNQTIELAAESLANVKFVQEKRLIQKYFDEISQDTGKYCFGIEDKFKALELGAVETLIVWENLDIARYILRNAAGEDTIYHNKEQDKDRSKFLNKSTGLEIEQSEEPQMLLEWFADKYKEFGANLEFVTNRSQEGEQYKVDFTNLASVDEEDEDEFYSDDDDI
ncbi:50S ribosomal protein L30e-like protein [Desarmillaria tabescens]|uniref:50S ribosomal protein L30e-like protein n=1 Tax=Armillaria tabescens TaxID=1929756 RepID=A0AA39J235_ARMTA|nr:50S ribosomal protein L30e-like protein [Desarmillaria tabescens]KAK0434055.1 50S ribosomal protein L30e-like protein [Desarmillaria tabescens]